MLSTPTKKQPNLEGLVKKIAFPLPHIARGHFLDTNYNRCYVGFLKMEMFMSIIINNRSNVNLTRHGIRTQQETLISFH
jgi:hypothetical protein